MFQCCRSPIIKAEVSCVIQEKFRNDPNTEPDLAVGELGSDLEKFTCNFSIGEKSVSLNSQQLTRWELCVYVCVKRIPN